MLRYSILDPTGNITALVESPVEISLQPLTAAAIMRRHPEVEQVGFLRDGSDSDSVRAELRMAGGEFCGNASMSAAALLLSKGCQSEEEVRLELRVSGAAEPVALCLRPEGQNAYLAEIVMPPVLGISETAFAFGNLRGALPLVRLEGISHLVIEPDSVFFALSEDRPEAEKAVRDFCEALGADGLGLMFLDGNDTQYRMTPLVFVPGSGTCFWEKSCASGSAAVGMYLAAKTGSAAVLSLSEPGGVLCVRSDPKSGETRLYGHVRVAAEFEIPEAEL
jgi:diaminopimelate epimerase